MKKKGMALGAAIWDRQGCSPRARCGPLLTSLVATAAAGALAGLAPAARAQDATAHSFEIAAEPLSDALVLFGLQSGFQVSIDGAAVRGVRSQGVKAHVSAGEALSQLLRGTGFAYTLTRDVVTIRRAVDTTDAGGTAGSPGSAVMLGSVSVIASALDDDQQRPDGPGMGYLATRTASATKTDTAIEEAPRSIYVITSQQMQDQQPQTVADALLYTPGIYAKADGDYTDASSPNSNDGMTQRGFTSSQFVDGLQSFSYSNLEPTFLERIEVLNGPSSTQYGQGTPGGLVNMTLKKPTETPLRSVSVGVGSWGRVQGTFDLSDKIAASGSLRYRVAGIGLLSGTEVDHVKQRRWGFTPSLTWDIGSRTSISLVGQYVRTPDTGSTPFTRPALGTLYSFPGHGYLARSTYLGDLSANQSKNTQELVEGLLRHTFSPAIAFNTTVRWEHSTSQNQGVLVTSSTTSPDTGVYSRSGQGQYRYTYSMAADSHLGGKFTTLGIEHTWLAGFDYRHYHNMQDILTTINSSTTTSVDIWDPVITGGYTPCFDFTPGVCNASLKSQSYTRDQYGAYVQDQMRWHGFIATLGMRNDWTRYTSVVLKYKSSGTLQNDTSVYTPQKDSAQTYEATLSYKSGLGLVPYFSFSTSFSPDEGQTDWEGHFLPPTTGVEKELGLKYKMPGKDILLTASAFHNDNNHTAIEDTVHSTDAETYETDGGRTTSKGFELAANANISRHTRFMASYTYTKARFDTTTATATIINPTTGVSGATVSEEGKYLAKVPRRMASAFASQDILFVPGLSVNGGVRYVGSTFADAANSFKVGAYTLVDVGANYDLEQLADRLKGFKATLAISNLTNKYYVASCSSTSCYLGQGRRIFFNLSASW